MYPANVRLLLHNKSFFANLEWRAFRIPDISSNSPILPVGLMQIPIRLEYLSVRAGRNFAIVEESSNRDESVAKRPAATPLLVAKSSAIEN